MRNRLIRILFIISIVLTNNNYWGNCFGQKISDPINIENIDPSHLPYRFERLRRLSGNRSEFPIDINNDNIDELLEIGNYKQIPNAPNNLYLRRLFPDRSIFDKPFTGIIQHPITFDLDNDGLQEIIFSQTTPDTAYLSIVSIDGEIKRSIVVATKPLSLPNSNTETWDCNIKVISFMDVTNDGRLDMLLAVNTGHAYQPRGVYAYDYHNNQFEWKYPTGHNIHNPQLIDITGDGHREILLGSSAPGNGEGIPVNETDDLHSYLVVLDSLGNYQYREKFGDKFTTMLPYVHDFDGDGEEEVFLLFYSNSNPREDSWIGFWNLKTNEVRNQLYFEKIPSREVNFLDVDRNGIDEILLGWDDGTIEIRNHRLEVINICQIDNYFPFHFIVTDLNNDGEEELAVSGVFKGKKLIVLLNRHLELLGYRIGDLLLENTVNMGFGKRKTFTASSDDSVYLMSIKTQVVFFRKVSWGWLWLGFCIGMVFLGSVLTAVHYKKLKRTRIRTLTAVFESDKMPSMLLDTEGSIIIINHEMEYFLSIVKQEVIGFHYDKVFSSTIWNQISGIVKASFKENLAFHQDEFSIVQNGDTIDILVFVGTLYMHKSIQSGKIVKIQDITDLAQSKRAVAWASMAQKLAHEIKTPLSTVMLSAQRLQMENGEIPDKKKGSNIYSERIIGQVERLQKMTDAFLKFAQIEKPQFEPFNMNKMILECLEESSYKIGSGIQVKKQLSSEIPAVTADRHQLLIVLQNLIDNSLNAMKGKGVLTLSTRLVQSLQTDGSKRSDETVQIELADTGSGISKENMSCLFQPFFSKSTDGTGLGLVIVKKIVEDHKGTIRIESEADVGTTVLITLPVGQ